MFDIKKDWDRKVFERELLKCGYINNDDLVKRVGKNDKKSSSKW